MTPLFAEIIAAGTGYEYYTRPLMPRVGGSCRTAKRGLAVFNLSFGLIEMQDEHLRNAQRCVRCRAMPASTVSRPAAITPAGTRPSVRWPRSAWLAWLESTDPLLWWDRAEPALWYDSSEAADIADASDPAEANEPMLANDAKEAALPTERIESWEQIERTEFSDQRDHTRRSVAFAGSTCRSAIFRSWHLIAVGQTSGRRGTGIADRFLSRRP